MIAGKNDMLDRRSPYSARAVCAESREGNEQANRNELITLTAAEALVTQSVVGL